MKKTLLLLLSSLSLCASEFPAPYNSEPDQAKPMPAAEAAATMRLPPGFKATVFAAEPDVQNPIAMAWDGRGRLWVAENYTYAEGGKKFDLNLRDRILIFELLENIVDPSAVVPADFRMSILDLKDGRVLNGL